MPGEPSGVNSTGLHPDVLTAGECEECRTWGSGSVFAAVFADFDSSSSSLGLFCHIPSNLAQRIPVHFSFIPSLNSVSTRTWSKAWLLAQGVLVSFVQTVFQSSLLFT